MFDGSFKSKRNINLGGSRQAAADKKLLLQKAAEERKARELQKRRLHSSVKIQHWYRQKRISIQQRNAVVQEWDQNNLYLQQSMGNINAGASTGSSAASLMSDTILQLSTTFLSFFRTDQDHGRSIDLCRILLSNVRLNDFSSITRTETTPTPIVIQMMALVKQWPLVVQQLLRKYLNHLSDCQNDEEGLLVLELLDGMTLSASFQSLTGLRLPMLVPPSALAQRYLDLLLASDVLPKLSHRLTTVPSIDNSKHLTAKALGLALRLCKGSTTGRSSTDSVLHLDLFVRYIMTLPLLPNRISLQDLESFKSQLPYDNIIRHLASPSPPAWISSLSDLPTMALAGNLLAFGFQRVGKMSTTWANHYLRALTTVMDHIPLNVIEPQLQSKASKSRQEDDDEDEDDDDREWITENVPGGASGATTTAKVNKVDPRVLKWLAIAHSNTHMNDILGSVEPVQSEQQQQQVQEKKSIHVYFSTETIVILTAYMVKLMALFPSHRITLLSSLMYFRFGSKSSSGQDRRRSSSSSNNSGGVKFFGVSIINVFLDAFTDSGLFKEIKACQRQRSIVSPGLVTDSRYGNDWTLFGFVAELYCQILVTMGDDDFMNAAKNPIGLDQVVELSWIARDIAFTLWWNDNQFNLKSGVGGAKNLTIGELREMITKLTKQLHARDSRVGFCPTKDHWVIKSNIDQAHFKRSVMIEEELLYAQEEEQGGDNEGGGTADMDIDMAGMGMMGMRNPASLMRSAQQQRIRQSRRLHSSLLAKSSPRLGILNNIPFVIPFQDRVEIFRQFAETDKLRRPWINEFSLMAKASIRRDRVFEDGYEHLNRLGPRLKGRISITFVNSHGMVEDGIDGGGVFKEFLTSIVKEAFTKEHGLFLQTPQNLLYPNPEPARDVARLEHYAFLGRILGKALYAGVLIDASFAGFFLSKCLGQVNYLDDLASFDEDVYRNLMLLKEQIDEVETYFTIDEAFGEHRTINLIPNGDQIRVTKDNIIRYIYLYAHYRLNVQIEKQCRAFFRGLSDMIDPKWLYMFNQHELAMVLGGSTRAIDVLDLKRNVVYARYGDISDEPTLQFFWSVVEQDMNDEERRKLVQFITSCSRPPLLGFGDLQPKICIAHAGHDQQKLPSASTCMNLLKLPQYMTREILKRKLLYAIEAGAGFDLS